MADLLKDKAAVVTGAGRGLGRAFAMALAAEGAKVVVNDLGVERDGSGVAHGPADDVVAEIKAQGGEAVSNYDNVTITEGGENIIKTCVDSFGKIDILVNNAGILRDRMLFNMSPEEWDSVIKVHLYGLYNCTKPACILMRQQRSGRIINITSPTALMGGNPGQSNYGAAKAGVMGFTRVVSREMGRYGVTVNAFCPVAATRMTQSPEMEAARQQRPSRPQAGAGGPGGPPGGGGPGGPPGGGGPGGPPGGGGPGGPPAQRPRMAEPEDNAPMIVFLATDAAANINGQTFGLSGTGGVSLYAPFPPALKSIHKDGRWTVDELVRLVPTTLAQGLVNPSPPQPPKE